MHPFLATYLAVHYLRKSPSPCKAIVMLGSMASWQAVPGQPMYSAAKHGVLGLMRSLYKPLATFNIRIAVIHPFFAGI
jgi:NAD(P)-dependent dehydrogenase (short-subunit alcohol dehydrogenase family)